MKKILCIALMFCCVSLVHAQYKTVKKNEVSSEELMDRLDALVDQFCKYVEVIGSTGSVSEAEKNRMRRQDVPELFYRYNERKMITTYGQGGKGKSQKKMFDYFRNLQTQAKSNNSLKSKNNVTYDMEFVFACTNGELNWKYLKTHEDGTKLYGATVYIYQTYMKETRTGVEIMRSRREVDKKEMTVHKMVLPDTSEVYKLGDINRAERLETANR